MADDSIRWNVSDNRPDASTVCSDGRREGVMDETLFDYGGLHERSIEQRGIVDLHKQKKQKKEKEKRKEKNEGEKVEKEKKEKEKEKKKGARRMDTGR